MSHRPHARRVAACVAVTVVALLPAPARALELREILEHFDSVQGSIQTLQADFVETTSNQLLKEPLVAEGRFYMTKPDAIRWEYVRPEPMRFVIAQDRYTGYFPERKQAETRSVKRWSERIFRFIGLGQVSSELEKLYEIRLEPESDIPGTYLLAFEPQKKRVKRRVDAVRFWIDETSWLPRRVEYLRQNGDSRVIEFQNIALNPDLAAALYEVELPPDVKVVKGIGGLPGFGDDEPEAQ
jgi:outer membrane lipoprotein-sorting protein